MRLGILLTSRGAAITGDAMGIRIIIRAGHTIIRDPVCPGPFLKVDHVAVDALFQKTCHLEAGDIENILHPPVVAHDFGGKA